MTKDTKMEEEKPKENQETKKIAKKDKKEKDELV